MSQPNGQVSQNGELTPLLAEIGRLDEVFAGWGDVPRGAVASYRAAIEALHGEALRRLVRALRVEPAAMAAMRQAAADEFVYAVLRRHGIVKPSLDERIEVALESIRPMLASHNGDVELVRVAPPAIEVRFLGACDGCPASALTFHAGVKKVVQDACPEITEIVQVRGSGSNRAEGVHFVSPFALAAASGWLAAGHVSEIPHAGIRVTELGGHKLLLSRHGVVVTCFENACAHLGFPIHDGEVEDGIVTCPHHGFRYDLRTGECLTAPEVQLLPHAVRVTGGQVEVRLTR